MNAQDPTEPEELVRLRAKVNLLLAMNSYATSDRKRDLQKISRLNTELSQLNTELSQLNTELSQFREMIQKKDIQLSELRQQLQELFGELSDIRTSTSWKMTAPLRSVGSWAKRSRK